MNLKSITKGNNMYKLELQQLISEIKKQKAKQVLIQLPDGMKHKADQVVDAVEEQTESTPSCVGGIISPTCNVDFEHIIVDSKSTDSSLDILKNLG